MAWECDWCGAMNPGPCGSCPCCGRSEAAMYGDFEQKKPSPEEIRRRKEDYSRWLSEEREKRELERREKEKREQKIDLYKDIIKILIFATIAITLVVLALFT